MSNASIHHVVIGKSSQRHLNGASILDNQIPHIMGAVSKSMAVRGWAIAPMTTDTAGVTPWYETDLVDSKTADKYLTELYFTLTHSGEADTNSVKAELKALAKAIHVRSTAPLGGRWDGVKSIDGKEYVVSNDGETLTTKDFTSYAPIEMPEDFETPFDHLYGLDSHIGRVKGALNRAISSSFTKRYHVALIGKPGCGKSDICETIASIFGDDAVMKFDGTQTTAAGAIKQIAEAEITPRVLIVEEIEKVSPDALSYLLAVMDTRGEIRKTTARSEIRKDTKILVIATVNNVTIFEGIMSGALASRFANPCWFKRPSEEVIRKILTREIADVDGDFAWIDPVMAYVNDKGISDPRVIVALALCGADGWLDGSYEAMLKDTDRPSDY